MRTIVLAKLTCEIGVGSHFHTVAIRMSQGVYTQKDPIQNREEDGDEEEEEGEEDVDKHQKLRAKYRKLKKLLASKKKKALAKDEKRRKAKTKRVHTVAVNKKCNSYRNAKKAGNHAHEKSKVRSRCDRSDDDLDMLVDLLEADEDISDILPSSQQFPKVEESLLKKKQKFKSIYDNAVDGTLVEDGNEAINLDDVPFTQPFKGYHWETAGLNGSSTQPMDVGKISERDTLTDGRFSRCKETGFEEDVGRQESSPDNTSIFDGLLDETLMEYDVSQEATSLDYSSSTLPFYQQSKDKNLTENGHLECDGGSIVTPEGRGSKNEMKKESLPQNGSRKYPRKGTEVKNCNLKVCKREISSILSNDKIMPDEDRRRETKGNQSDSDAFSDESMIIFSSSSEDEGFLSVSSKPSPALTKGNDGTSLLTKDKRRPWFIPEMPKERVQKDTLMKTNKKSKKGGKKSEFISEVVELKDAQTRKTDMANDGKVTCSNQQFSEKNNGDSYLTKPKTIASRGKIIGSNKKNKKQQQKPESLTKAVVGLTDTQDCRNGVATDNEGTFIDQQLTETADGFSHLKKRSKFIPYQPKTIASQGKIIGSNKKSKKQKQKPGSIPETAGLKDSQDCRNGVATVDEGTFIDQQLTETANGSSNHATKKPVFIPYRPNVNELSQRSMDSAKEQPKKSEPHPLTLELGDNQHCKSDMANDEGTGSSTKCDSHLTKGPPGFIPYEPNVIVSQTSSLNPARKNRLQERESESIPETLQDISESAVGDTRNPADGLTEEETAKPETDLYPKMSDQTKLTDMKGWNLPKGWETYREATVHKKTKGFHEAETHGGDGPVIPSHQLKKTTEICPPRTRQEFTQSTSTQTETTFHQFLSFFSVCEKFFCDYENVTTTASLDNVQVDIDDPPSRKKLKKVMKKIKKSKRKQAKASKLRMSSSGQLSGSRKRRTKHSAKKRAIEHYTSPTGQSNMLHHPKLLFDNHTSSGHSSSEDFAVHRK